MLHCARFSSKIFKLPTAQYTLPTLEGLLRFIPIFTWPQSYTVALRQYFCYPLQIAGLSFKLFYFRYVIVRGKL